MKEHLSGAEVRPCVAGGKGEGVSVKCQCFFCEARLIKGGLVSDLWPRLMNTPRCCNLMHEKQLWDWDDIHGHYVY